MNQPPLARAAFLRTLRRCHTEAQLFSRLTFACLAQYDEAQRPELLDDVRGAAYSLRLPAVEYKTDQWLHRCQDAIDTDRDAFLAAANAEARRENDKMRAEQTPVGPGVLADVPLQNVDWLVPDLLPRGELSLLGAAGGVETVFTAMALRTGWLPGAINLENPDPNCDLDYMAGGSAHIPSEYAMCNSFGFGGTNASLILKKWNH